MSSVSLWTINSGTILAQLEERTNVNIPLPITQGLDGVEVELISGNLPRGTRIENTNIVGTAYEVSAETVYTSVLRASWRGNIDDRTIRIQVSGPDDPEWRTPEGLLPAGPNNRYFILDSEPIDFQLLATDTDLPAGDVLEYFIAQDDGSLPPGIELTTDGRLVGVTEPLLSLDKRYQGGGYDTVPYGSFPLDFATLSGNGYDSFFYDSQVYGFSVPTQSQRKLNRYYPFAVTVTDGRNFVRREFKIYVVGDDFLRADNTIIQVANGVFTADNTHIRTPVWITPGDLGYRRADNYQTIYLETINPPTLSGAIGYTLENLNSDGSVSELPPGMILDGDTGIVAGRIPYQPAITKDYKFTVRATRFTGDIETVTIFANFYEDTLLGNTSFKIYKIDLTGNQDNINDLLELVGRDILLNGNIYTVNSVDNTNEDYDLITLNRALLPQISLMLSRKANTGQDYLVVNRLDVHQQEKYQNRKLIFSDTEQYTIQSVVSYVEYQIEKTTPDNDPILPATVPVDFTNTNYVIDEIVEYQGNIYKCITAHTATAFVGSNWQLLGTSLNELSDDLIIKATKDALAKEFGRQSYIFATNRNLWNILVPSTTETRNINNISQFFAPSSDSAVHKISFVRDNQDVVHLDVNLSRQINQGKNIGIALFQNGFFSEDVAVVSDDPVDNPSKNKTFNIRILGEVDSTITWLTGSDLGTISANLPSNLKVQATSTVPDSRMVYRLVSGKLPNGMVLSYTGEIIGRARQFPVNGLLGLTTFDNKTVTWDGSFPGDTTFDRKYTFTIEARDRFNYSASTKEFTLFVEDLDNTKYTDIYMKPMLKPAQREYYRNFISDSGIFTPDSVYRPNDPEFGVQEELKCLVYAGIEAKKVQEFVAAAAKNHKRKRYTLGEPKIANAAFPGTIEIIYQVIYIPVIDPQDAPAGKTRVDFSINNSKKITADSIQYAPIDDETGLGLGVIDSSVEDAEPFRFRPTTNTIKTDSNAIKISDTNDIVRYISNINNMRDRIQNIGITERDYLPLWMRTPQSGFQELNYVSAIPIVFCKPGEANDILLNINNSDFDFKQIDYEIDRYIVQRTENSEQEQYILFANYQYNV